MAKKVKIDRELYDRFYDMMDNQRIIDKLQEENKELRDKVDTYMTSYMNASHDKIKLWEENKVLKDALNKEQDTQIIKYQGKIYKITSTAHFSDINEPDTLDINATYCGEVNEDGKGEM
jgi:ribosomal protein S17E